MDKGLTRSGSRKPPIHIKESDYDIIAGLALRMEHRLPDLSKLILDEVDRAHLYPAAKLPSDVVALGSEVEYLDGSNGSMRRVRLVLPAEEDIAAGRMSVVTPVGAGLIGMRVGSEIDWPCPDGRPRTLKILEVEQQP